MNEFIDLSGDKKEEITYTVEKDPLVQNAIDLIEKSSMSSYRSDALSNISEDKEIYNALSDGLANEHVFAQLNNTILMQIIRLVSEDSHSLPEARPFSSKEVDESIIFSVSAIKRKYAIEGGLADKLKDITEHATFMEGTSFLRILPESYRDFRIKKDLSGISFQRVDAAKVFYDPKCVRDISEGEWAAFMETYGVNEAQEIAESLYGYKKTIRPGDALHVFEDSEGTGDDQDDSFVASDTTFYTFYHKTKKTYLVFAGADGELLKKAEGESFPCKDKFGACDIPVTQYDATSYKKGIHAMSYIGVAKDIARTRTKQFNTILPHFERVNSPILAVMGAISPQQLADDLTDAIEAQAQGLSGILPLADPQARVETIFPQDISAAFERIISLFDNELAKRLGLNLTVQEKQVTGGAPTATQVIEQSKVHAKAISNLNKINEKFFKRTFDIIVNYGRVLLKGSDETFPIGLDDMTIDVTGNDLIELIKNWRGTWTIDTSVELQLTRNEKISVMAEVTGELTGYLQLQIMSEAEIRPIRDLAWAKITLLKLNDFIQRKEFDEFFTAIATRNSKQQEIENKAMLEGGNQGGAPTGEQPPVQDGGGDGEEPTPDVQAQAAAMGAAAEQPSGFGI